MNIYFSAPIAGGMEQAQTYQAIIDWLQSCGHRVLTEHLWNEQLHADLRQGIYPEGMEYLASEEATYQQDVSWIEQAQLVIAEVSTPSLA